MIASHRDVETIAALQTEVRHLGTRLSMDPVSIDVLLEECSPALRTQAVGPEATAPDPLGEVEPAVSLVWQSETTRERKGSSVGCSRGSTSPEACGSESADLVFATLEHLTGESSPWDDTLWRTQDSTMWSISYSF